MIVVCDTTALTTLIKAGLDHLLVRLFGQVYIPQAVFDELSAYHPHLPDFVRVCPLRIGSSLGERAKTIGKGEFEALQLAIELGAGLLITDDRKARNFAREQGIYSRGILALCLIAKSRSDIASVKFAIEKIETEGGLYLSREVKEEALRMSGESQ